jgi:hypothetical protein
MAADCVNADYIFELEVLVHEEADRDSRNTRSTEFKEQ